MTATETKEWLDQLPEADRKKARAMLKSSMFVAEKFGEAVKMSLEEYRHYGAFRALTEQKK